MAVLLEVDRLSVWYGGNPAVSGVSFRLEPGQVMGLVGESGSGKTTVALSLLGHRVWGGRTQGDIRFQGQSVLALPPHRLRGLRGRSLAYVPQNPTTALNPVRKIGSLCAELLAIHGLETRPEPARERARAALEAFGFAEARQILDRYPHQLSGGQQQRVVLALATLCDPDVLILDEPTTGLDVSTQAVVLDLLQTLRQRRRMAMVYVTHDLGVLRRIATDVCVLYAGHLVENGPLDLVFSAPRHPYTRALLGARPDLRQGSRPATALRGVLRREALGRGCPFAPRCDTALPDCATRPQTLEAAGPGHRVACMRWKDSPPVPPPMQAPPVRPDLGPVVLRVDGLGLTYRPVSLFGLRTRPVPPALQDVSLTLSAGEVLAIVGESGSGKSSLARAIAGLVAPDAGHVTLRADVLARTARQRRKTDLRAIQLVFQNPDASLNPRLRVGQSLAAALASFEPIDAARSAARVAASLAEVNLPESFADRFPDQLSGGERQRVAIARALIVSPDVLICDEVLSALDVSVQAGILALLQRIAAARAMAILFISHDLAVVRAIADRVIVLFRGRIMASGPVADLLTGPLHPYVFALLSAIPDSGLRAEGPHLKTGAPILSGRGCAFATACPIEIDGRCRDTPPPNRSTSGVLLCHQTAGTLAATYRLAPAAPP
jgi:peptide/nickel transport system ATP-binding protein